MTAREVLEAALIELSKQHAPSMRLDEFNYYINKAVNQYINKRYNVYDVSQQSTDDLRVLKSTAILTPVKTSLYKGITDNHSDTLYNSAVNPYNNISEFDLPADYLHILNCICIYKVNKQYKCWNSNTTVGFPAKRLTADSWSVIFNDYYNRPLPWRPYYYIHNVNTSTNLPTNPYVASTGTLGSGTDGTVKQDSTSGEANLARTININGTSQSLVEKNAPFRYGNASKVRCEIRYGNDSSVFTLQNIVVDYLKTPQYIRLTPEQMDMTEDTSQIMEYPDYVCQEIINELVHLVMEHDSDPRLQTNIPLSQSIASPTQQQASK